MQILRDFFDIYGEFSVGYAFLFANVRFFLYLCARIGMFLLMCKKEQAMNKAMKIFIREDKGNKKYVPEIKEALQKAGHQVLLSSDYIDEREGLQSCHVCIDLTAAGKANDKESISRPFDRAYVDLRVRKMVQVIGKVSLPRRQIVADLGLKQRSRRIFIYNYLKPSVDQGYVTMSNPDIPSKPDQTYKLTAKGLQLYKDLMGE